MAKSKEIRIPRTTALFITGLGRILRQYFHLEITEHECWTFVRVAGWEECSARGQCGWHGFSEQFLARMERDHPDQVKFMDSWTYRCDIYQISIYLGTGQVEVAGKKNDLRVRLKETEHDVYGPCFEICIWLRGEDGEIQKGIFGLMENGDPYPIEDKRIEAQPPRKIAFWKDTIQVEHSMDN